MKKVYLTAMIFSALCAQAFGAEFCVEPKHNVSVRIDVSHLADDGTTFCYATEIQSKKQLPILNCGMYTAGDVVLGKVVTNWTHKDLQGNPVCNFQHFIPYSL